MFNFSRRDSMTSIGLFMEISLPTFNTVVHSSHVLFHNQLTIGPQTVLCSGLQC